MSRKRKFYIKKRFHFPILIVVLLLAFRIYLPFWIKKHVNQVLSDIPGYYGEVEDVDVSLIRGAYVLEGLYLNKKTAKTEIPFLNFPESDISLEWKSLFKGRVVSEIEMLSPELIYVFEDHEKKDSADADVDDWTKALTDLVPIDINHFEVYDGKIAFIQLQTNPNIDLHINKVHLVAHNLSNVVDKEKKLPSPIWASGVSIGNGKVSLKGDLNLLKRIPDMDLDFSIKDAQATAVNEFTRHYAGIDFESGTLGLYCEVAINDGYLKGYIKPLLQHSKLIGKEESFLSKLWEGFVGFFKFILKNQGTDTLATKIPIEGDLNDVDAGVWPTIFNIFENAWIHAFQGKVDQDIDFSDAKRKKDKD